MSSFLITLGDENGAADHFTYGSAGIANFKCKNRSCVAFSGRAVLMSRFLLDN
jgi:hypothetical protein